MQRAYFIEGLEKKGYKHIKSDYVGRAIYELGDVAVLFGERISDKVTIIFKENKLTKRYDNWKDAHNAIKVLTF